MKRAYEPPSAEDGERILVERLWPRGLSKAEAALDEWAKDIAPSPALRTWFGHDPEKWDEFAERYARELHDHPDAVKALRDRARHGPVTLIYAARDERHNSAIVLRRVLLGQAAQARH